MVTIKAKKVRRGHTIPGLDNAYVIEVENERSGFEEGVRITFNDALGGEGYLIVPKNHPIVVKDIEPEVW